jgi:S-DNA-T family DNA segregation ATPase FtsK/SpoIIIE
MDVVIRTPHGDAEVRIGTHHPATRLVDVLEIVTGRSVPPVIEVDGYAVPSATPLDDAGVLEGSVLDVGATTAGEAPGDAVDLVQVAGWGTTTRTALAPGTYRIGPGRRVNAPELASAPVDTVGFELHVAAGAPPTVRAASERVRVDGVEVGADETAVWTGGVLDVLGRAFTIDRHEPGPPRRPTPIPGAATVAFNRPPLRAPSPPVEPPADAPAHARTRQRRTPSHAPEIDTRRHAEVERRRAAWVLPADAVALAAAAGPQLWRQRSSPAEPMDLVVGLGDVAWRPTREGPDHGVLAMVPITVDLRREQGVALVGSSDFVRAAARGVIMTATLARGPADLAIVVATQPDRLGAWEWVKWLPHARTAGTIDLLTTADAIAAVVETTLRDGGPTLLVADDPAWWRERAAPLRPLFAGAGSPIRLLALVGDAGQAPTLCTTLVIEDGDRATVERLLERQRVEHVHPLLVPVEAALDTARHLAALDDPDLAPPADDPAHRRAPVLDLLLPRESGTESTSASTGVSLAGRIIDRWSGGDRAPTLLPVGRDGGVTITLELDRHAPHVVVAGPEAPDVTRGLLAALAVVAAPDEVGIVLIGPPATFGRCTDLPHVVGAVAHPDGREAERVLRCLRAELRRRVARDSETRARLVIALDEPTARDVEGFAASVTEIAREGATHGMHLLVATDRPADAFDDDLGPLRVARLQVASRLGELTTRPSARSSLCVGVGRAVELDPITARSPATELPPPDSPEVVPFVVGRDPTPMERRLARGAHVDAADTTPAGAFDALVAAIARAAAETGRFPERACVPPLLPDAISLAELLAAHPGDGVPWAVDDLPDEQRHAVRWWRPTDHDSVLVVGARGIATSWPIATLTLGIAARTSPDDVHVYLVGDASGTFDELARLAHVGVATGVDRLETVGAVLAGLADEVAGRLDTVAARPRAGTAARRPRRDPGTSRRPTLVLMIDDIGALRLRLRARADLAGRWDDFERIVRFGAEVGVVVVAVARDRHDLPPGLESSFSTRLAVDDAAGAPVGRAVDLRDGDTAVQLAEPPPSLRHAVDELTSSTASSTAAVRPPLAFEPGGPL